MGTTVKKIMKKNTLQICLSYQKIVIVAIIIIIMAISIVIYRNKPTTLTMKQFINKIPCKSKNVKSYDPGDSVDVTDKIAIIMTEYEYHGNYDARGSTYDGTNYDYLLYIWFKTKRGYSGFTFGAEEWSTISDYRNSTHTGDTITIDIQIIDAKSNDWRNEWFIGHISGNSDLEILYFVPFVPIPPVPGGS